MIVFLFFHNNFLLFDTYPILSSNVFSVDEFSSSDYSTSKEESTITDESDSSQAEIMGVVLTNPMGSLFGPSLGRFGRFPHLWQLPVPLLCLLPPTTLLSRLCPILALGLLDMEMTPTIIGVVASMFDAWQAKLQLASGQVEVDVRKEFNTLTADVIAHTAFGSSYAEGKQVFELQYEQRRIFGQLQGTIGIPGSRFLPTTFNKHRWRLSKQINSILTGIIQKRLGITESGSKIALKDDLLGLMLAASKEESKGSHETMKLTLQDIIAECKTFFFAGHETTSSLLTWAVFLLSIYPEWQEKAREEVKDLFGTSHPDAEALSKMKVVGMILHETLRLYPPVTAILRKASKSLKLRDLNIQKGTLLFIPISMLHTDPTFWGSDAQEFNPERFANGMLKACSHPVAFLPFSLGPRNCVGQNFTMIEAKVALCMVLQRFQFHLSPGYKHCPATYVTLQPEYGMQIIMEPC
ncbi:hypothetical protein L7F22_059629 [Adiantum nelumboides]|nr:hypothetical protein [Adiantum nelumboides]